MAKWMGFFLSEHTTSLKDERKREDQTSLLTVEEKWMLLSQLYVGKLQASITVPYRMMRQTLIGEVSELYESEISLKTEERLPPHCSGRQSCKFSWWKANEYCIEVRY